jgi:hypothetical protein
VVPREVAGSLKMLTGWRKGARKSRDHNGALQAKIPETTTHKALNSR